MDPGGSEDTGGVGGELQCGGVEQADEDAVGRVDDFGAPRPEEADTDLSGEWNDAIGEDSCAGDRGRGRSDGGDRNGD